MLFTSAEAADGANTPANSAGVSHGGFSTPRRFRQTSMRSYSSVASEAVTAPRLTMATRRRFRYIRDSRGQANRVPATTRAAISDTHPYLRRASSAVARDGSSLDGSSQASNDQVRPERMEEARFSCRSRS